MAGPDSGVKYNVRNEHRLDSLVPDYFAAEFSGRFYRYLLSGKNLGDAMHQTRLDLLTMPKRNNPLGLLYLLYADPSIKVLIAKPELAPEPVVPKPTGRRRK